MKLFEYDRSRPYGLRVISSETQGVATVRRVDYLELDGQRMYAIFVVPAGDGPFGGALYLHGAGGSPENWLDEAVELAAHGVVSLLVTQPEGIQGSDDPDPWKTEIVFEMRELRRALDLLASQPNVDAWRLAFIGYSFGAVRGATFAGIEGARLKTAVLMCFNPHYVRGEVMPFDPIAWLPHVSPAALLMQLGEQDTWYTTADGDAMLAAAREPKELLWYDTGHGLNEEATADRAAWLTKYVGDGR